MIPIGDDNSDRRSTPVVTWMLIALNVFVFVVFQGLGSNERFTMAYATVPDEILTGRDIAQSIPIRDEYGRTLGAIELAGNADSRLPDALISRCSCTAR